MFEKEQDPPTCQGEEAANTEETVRATQRYVEIFLLLLHFMVFDNLVVLFDVTGRLE